MKYYRVFGLAQGKKETRDFNGEIVYIEDASSNKVTFEFEGKPFTVRKEQLKLAELLFPATIYVREGGLHNLQCEKDVVINDGQIANCYARRGSHWIKYHIDPKDLVLIDEDDEELAIELAQKVANLVFTQDHLRSVLKKSSLSDEEIESIIKQL